MTTIDQQLLYKIAITKIPLVGAINAKNLISYCGGVEAVFESSKKALLQIPGIGPSIAENIRRQQSFAAAEKEIEFIDKFGIQTLFFLDDDYPFRMKQQYDCPIVLYYKGNADLNHQRIVGVVGTRKPSIEGRHQCEAIMDGLVKYGVQTVSGLAYGIDICCHRSCLQLGIPTIGVMGNGFKHIYPAAHKSTARRMTEQGGLLTEYTSELGPDREHFPMRNRIIAGLCDALLVVETARKGGSMISAEIAHNYNRDVFALPGPVNQTQSAGCNFLIKTHRASLLENADDIAYVMGWKQDDQDSNKPHQMELFNALDELEKKIVDLLRQENDLHVDRLSRDSSIPSMDMARLLLELEFKGLIRSLPGNRYRLL